MKKELTLTLDPDIHPLFLRIASAIRCGIKLGHLVKGERLPSAIKLADQLKTSRHTIMAAGQELVAQGWLEAYERSGYRVAVSLPVESSANLEVRGDTEIKKFDWKSRTRSIKVSAPEDAHSFAFNFAGGIPDVSCFPFSEFRSCFNDTLNRPRWSDLGYGSKQGEEGFLRHCEQYIRRMRSITGKSLISINGSQEGLFLIAQLMLEQGDRVLVENLGYRPAWQAFYSTGAELEGVYQDEDGIDLQDLKQKIAHPAVKMLYLTPLHQYPTTVTLSMSQRIEIYRLAAEYEVVIVEDDYDHEFHFHSQPLAPLAADDPCGLVVYLSTFSKIMFPGCRTGIMAVDPKLVEPLLNYRSVINHKPNVLIQQGIGNWMESGGFERHLRRMTRLYHQRRDAMVEHLTQLQHEGHQVNFEIPAGGMALWLDIGQKARELKQRCAEVDIYLQSEDQFHLNADNNQNRFIRIGFAGQNEEKAQQGLENIFQLHKQALS